MVDITATLNCIQRINNFGSTEYVNVCNGTRELVNWGSLDFVRMGLNFVCVGFAIIAVILVMLFILSMLYKIIFD